MRRNAHGFPARTALKCFLNSATSGKILSARWPTRGKPTWTAASAACPICPRKKAAGTGTYWSSLLSCTTIATALCWPRASLKRNKTQNEIFPSHLASLASYRAGWLPFSRGEGQFNQHQHRRCEDHHCRLSDCDLWQRQTGP